VKALWAFTADRIAVETALLVGGRRPAENRVELTNDGGFDLGIGR
jgi:hypothetical protein